MIIVGPYELCSTAHNLKFIQCFLVSGSTHIISGGNHSRSPKTRLQNAATRMSNNATATASLIRHPGTSNFNYSGDDAASEESD